MDSDLARTFLAVVSHGSFVAAAERVHVSQSTVSARIQTLERQLGCVLFVRNKAGAALTPAGLRFQRYAGALVRLTEQARHDVGLPRGFTHNFVVGGRIGLWEEFLLHWLPQIQRDHPGLSIRAESALEPELMQGLIDGRLDLGVMYTPHSRPGLVVEKLFVERLVLVSSKPRARPAPQPGYVYIDWGPEFFARHAACFPDYAGASLTANIGWLGLQHVLAHGGSGYFPQRIVAPHLAAKRLHAVRKAPEFFLDAYAVYPASGSDLAGRIVESLRRAAKSLG